MEGWIKIDRKIRSNWIWKDSVKLKWWFDILLEVNFEDNKFQIGYQLFECKRGESLMSLQNWAKRWNVSKSVVNNFFKLLQQDGMITLKSETVTTRLTVCNYDTYQTVQNAFDTHRKRIVNATVPQQSTIKEYKEDKEYKKVLLSEIVISDYNDLSPDYFQIALSFQGLFRENLIQSGASTKTADNMKGISIDDIRLIIENDKYTIDDLRQIYNFLQKDDFWKANILSTSKLRKQMDKLKLKIANNGKIRRDFKEGTTFEELAAVIESKFAGNSQR